MKRKFHVRCEAGENLEITSKSYLSLSTKLAPRVIPFKINSGTA